MIEALVVFLVVLWLVLWLAVHVAGGFVHLIVIAALIILAIKLYNNRKRI